MSDEEFVTKFLDVLGKAGCTKTEEEIRHHFCLHREAASDLAELEKIGREFDSGEINSEEMEASIRLYYEAFPEQEDTYFSGVMMLLRDAMNDLSAGDGDSTRWYLEDFMSSQAKVKKLERLNKKTMKVLEALTDPDIQEYMRLSSCQIDECDYPINDASIAENIPYQIGLGDLQGQLRYFKRANDAFFMFYHIVKSDLKRIKKPRGRPQLNGLDFFVYNVAILYEKLSGEKFTVDSHKDKEPYRPITKGMDFVWVAIDWLYREASDMRGIENTFTSTNLVTSCEKARARIKKSQ